MKNILSTHSYNTLFLLTVSLTSSLSLLANTPAAENHQKERYLYCNKNHSRLSNFIEKMSNIDDNKDSSVCRLNQYIREGFVAAQADEILETLKYAEAKLDQLYKQLSSEQADKMYTDLYMIIEEIAHGGLDVDMEFIHRSGCCPSPCSNDKIIKVRNKLYVLNSAKFFQNVEFKNNVEIEGTLSVADQAIDCDLTVGCNINMNNSTSATVGNILKDGLPFISNFGTRSNFIGIDAGNFLITSITGNNNGVGQQALNALTTGYNNTALGDAALFSTTTGNNNVAFGPDAMRNNVTGNLNTSIGSSTLFNLTSGNRNVALGFSSGSVLTIGSDNIYIAANASTATENTTTRIGTLQTRCFIQGINGVTTALTAIPVLVDANGQLGTISSSATRKHNIQDMNNASERIYRLRPVTFAFNGDASETEQFGLIAEEVDEVFPELVAKDQDGRAYAVHYETLPALLLNEIQKQQDKIDALIARVTRLEQAAA